MSKYENTDLNRIARLCKALGNETRLQMMAGLLACCGESSFEIDEECEQGKCPSGLNVGKLGESAELAASTISHHIRELREAGLIEVERDGRQVFCRANLDQVRRLSVLLGQLAGSDELQRTPAGECFVIVKPNNKTEVIR